MADRSSQLNPNKTGWLLVDHNALQGALGEIHGAKVVGCIDHHDEEGKVPKDTGDEPRIVRNSGSCSSLVVESCKGAWDALYENSTSKEEKAWDTELAYLALAPVLIDTTNLTTESKVTSADTDAVTYLESRITDLDPTFTVENYFEEISIAKDDIGGLSLPDILRKDYKQWTEAASTIVGICSIVKDLRFLVEKAGSEDDFLEILRNFATERDLSVVSIMTTANRDGEFRRELFVWGLNDRGIDVAKKFETESIEKLGLETWGAMNADGNGQFRRCWWQKRIENSRKQVAPMLRAAAQSPRARIDLPSL